MIGPGTGVRVYLACGVTDMRKAIEGLSMLAQDVLRQKPTGLERRNWWLLASSKLWSKQFPIKFTRYLQTTACSLSSTTSELKMALWATSLVLSAGRMASNIGKSGQIIHGPTARPNGWPEPSRKQRSSHSLTLPSPIYVAMSELKALSFKTPFEAIRQISDKKPEIFY